MQSAQPRVLAFEPSRPLTTKNVAGIIQNKRLLLLDPTLPFRIRSGEPKSRRCTLAPYLGSRPQAPAIPAAARRTPLVASGLAFLLQGSQNYLRSPSCRGGGEKSEELPLSRLALKSSTLPTHPAGPAPGPAGHGHPAAAALSCPAEHASKGKRESR